MVAIKDMAEMPKGCWYSTDLKLSGITTCPLKDYCSRKHIKEAPLDKRPKDCPLVEIEERKVGKWIPIWDSYHLVVLAYQCSECGIMTNTKSNYCPNCGCRMTKED